MSLNKGNSLKKQKQINHLSIYSDLIFQLVHVELCN